MEKHGKIRETTAALIGLLITAGDMLLVARHQSGQILIEGP